MAKRVVTKRGAKADTRVTKYQYKCHEVVQGGGMMDKYEIWRYDKAVKRMEG